MSMIELVRIEIVEGRTLELTFSDGTKGRWRADSVIERDTVLTQPLKDPAYFARAFIEAGALAWPNGLEFSAHSLHKKLDSAGGLVRRAA
jgi:hypothetical protein